MGWNMLASVYRSSVRRSRGRMMGWVPPQPKSPPYERVDSVKWVYRKPRPWKVPDDDAPWEQPSGEERPERREAKPAPARKQKAKPVEEPVEPVEPQEDIDTERFKKIERKKKEGVDA